MNKLMNFYDAVVHMFNGNETARAMRYSLSVVVILLLGAYFHIVSQEFVQNAILTALGYIYGKARSSPIHVSKDNGKTATNTNNSPGRERDPISGMER